MPEYNTSQCIHERNALIEIQKPLEIKSTQCYLP